MLDNEVVPYFNFHSLFAKLSATGRCILCHHNFGDHVPQARACCSAVLLEHKALVLLFGNATSKVLKILRSTNDKGGCSYAKLSICKMCYLLQGVQGSADGWPAGCSRRTDLQAQMLGKILCTPYHNSPAHKLLGMLVQVLGATCL